MSSADDDNEGLTLSSSTLSALQQFYKDRDAHTQQFAKLQDEAEQQHGNRQPLSMDSFSEDWNKSQFWYSEDTANLLAKELLVGATADTTIAVVSAPSVFVALQNLIRTGESKLGESSPKIILLEYDNRFSVFPQFVFYDFAQPLKLAAHLKGSIDRIFCDPPFLSEDCQTKVALTVRFLLKPSTASQTTESRVVVCTGERMESLVAKLYGSLGVRTTDYEPRHARGLGNEFFCYANFQGGHWHWRGQVMNNASR